MTINANAPASITNINYRWWEQDDNKIASALLGAATNIEKYSWHRRLLNLTCTRYITGRDMAPIYSYSMAKRPQTLTNRLKAVEWSVPTDNIIATCGDVYRARIWKQHPFVIVVPIAGNFTAYMKAIQMSRFCDAVFHDTGFWDLYEQCGDDAVAVGDAFIKVMPSKDRKSITITRVMGDEMLVNEEEALYGNPRSMIQRAFMHREEAIERYGDTPEKRDALWKTPGTHPGLYGGEVNSQDVLPMLEGYHLAGWDSVTDKRVDGVRCVSIAGILLERKPWKKDHFPFAHLKFARMPNGYFGQGLAEQLLPYQAELNRYDAADWENQRRISWPRVKNPIGSGVSTAQLMGQSGGVINYIPVQGLGPEFIFPTATDPNAESRRQRIKASAFLRARISENAAQGSKPEGLNSGVAIMAWASVDDSAHVDVGQRGEKFVTDVANLVFEVAEEVEPVVKLPGRNVIEIDWKECRLANDSYHARSFPMSNLPQLPAARQQKIQDWYANGQITKAIKMRLEQMPDIDGYMDLVNASENNIHMTLDAILETEDYRPPEPFQDLQQAIQIAQSRLLQERNRKTPENKLRLIENWILQCDELLSEGAPQIGIQPPAGAPAAPPQQVAPAQAQPSQIAA